MNCQFWEHLDGDGAEDKNQESHVILHGFLLLSFIIDYVINFSFTNKLFFLQKGEKIWNISF